MTPCATSSKISSCLLSWSNTLSNLSAREFKTNKHIILKGKSNCEHYIMDTLSSAVSCIPVSETKIMHKKNVKM